jgi:hypothetical protein
MAKSAWREYQDRCDNAGWRIKLIHPGDPDRVRMYQTKWGALAFAALFLYFALVAKKFGLAAAMLGGCFISALVETAWGFRTWTLVVGEIVDVELKLVDTVGDRGAPLQAWMGRVLCRYTRAGRTVEVTPAYSIVQRNFSRQASPQEVERYRAIEAGKIAQAQTDDRHLRMFVDEREPLSARLWSGSLAGRLLHLLSKKEPLART